MESLGKFSSSDQNMQQEAQTCIDECHRFTKLLSAVIFKTGKTITKRAAAATMKEIQSVTSRLFSSGGKEAKRILEEDIPSIDRITTSLCQKESINANDEKFSLGYHEDQRRETEFIESMKCRDYKNGQAVEEAVHFVRNLETQYSFQVALWKEKVEVSESLECSTDQLTYGSSSLLMWRELLEQESVRAVLDPSKSKTGKKNAHVVIFGASQGLLAIYTHSLCRHYGFHRDSTSHQRCDSFNVSKVTGRPLNSSVDANKGTAAESGQNVVHCTGYEVLPSLWAISNYLASKHFQHELQQGYLDFQLKDMLEADLTNADMVVLTSLCWDKDTRHKVARKLSKELRRGCVVVDYRAETFSDFGLDCNSYVYNQSNTVEDKDDDDSGHDNDDDGDDDEDDSGVIEAVTTKRDLLLLDRALLSYISQARVGAEAGAFQDAIFSEGGHADGCIKHYPCSTAAVFERSANRYRQKQIYSRAQLYEIKKTSSAKTRETSSKQEKKEKKEKKGSKAMGLFDLQGIIEGPCSWNDSQELYLHVME